MNQFTLFWRASRVRWLLAAAVLCPMGMVCSCHASGDGKSPAARPPLQVHRGYYFEWSAPTGWQEGETANGVTLNAPDNVTSVSSVLLMRSRGTTTPGNFAVRMLSMVPNLSDARGLAVRDMPAQPSGIGVPWKVQELEMVYRVNGVPARATWTVGIVSAYGAFDAFMLGYQAPSENFEAASLWLAPIARSIYCINPRQVAGNDSVMLPRNHPLDNSGLLESWRQKGLSEDRISQARREGTMGYERVRDSSGHIYNMPLERWDGTVGGYRDPLRPTEILQKARSGE